jgi:hypothetical protein
VQCEALRWSEKISKAQPGFLRLVARDLQLPYAVAWNDATMLEKETHQAEPWNSALHFELAIIKLPNHGIFSIETRKLLKNSLTRLSQVSSCLPTDMGMRRRHNASTKR